MPINVSQFYYDKDWAARTSYRIARVRGRTKPFHARAGERDAVHGGTERARNNKKKQEDTIYPPFYKKKKKQEKKIKRCCPYHIAQIDLNWQYPKKEAWIG